MKLAFYRQPEADDIIYIRLEALCKEMEQYVNAEKRTEAIEFGYGCAFMIDECVSIEDVEKVYDKWNEKTKETGTESVL